ncbi:LysM peptidoglycan-binding domain-containing protein [Aeromonas hydrophila]|uniref:hypothetical protein n=1 Tax=Aeromonas hydrophila TaxID=644 RepID=UPI0013037883|nr:hypothetical protein [Aeromonas hydrophila]QGZ71095.1 hypothetical protein GQR50_00255 [Aeromonas hydrophila]
MIARVIGWLCIVQCPWSWAAESFQFQSYRDGFLRMTLITPSVQGELFLRRDDKLEPLQGGIMVNLFTLRIPVSCQLLSSQQTLYWSSPGRPLIKSKVPAQSCERASELPLKLPVRIFAKEGECLIDTAGNTLWHTASELAKKNRASVYQNIYALFVTNKLAFAGLDIHRLRTQVLYCPDPTLFDHIDADHARQLFKEGLLLRQQ